MYLTFQILRDGGVGDNCAALQQRVRVAVPAAGGERGDHGEHARRQRLRPRLRVHRSLQGSPWKRTLNEQPDVFATAEDHNCYPSINRNEHKYTYTWPKTSYSSVPVQL